MVYHEIRLMSEITIMNIKGMNELYFNKQREGLGRLFD